jgi:Cu(I)/Ag(I) efflux system protein CusF
MKFMLFAISAMAVAGAALAQAAHDTPAVNAVDHAAVTPGAQGVGIIKKLDMKSGSVTLQHGPIAALSWPAMTMSFKAEPGLLQGLKVGEKVNFTVKPGAAPEVVAIKDAG